jgi:hypothetical protein
MLCIALAGGKNDVNRGYKHFKNVLTNSLEKYRLEIKEV